MSSVGCPRCAFMDHATTKLGAGLLIPAAIQLLILGKNMALSFRVAKQHAYKKMVKGVASAWVIIRGLPYFPTCEVQSVKYRHHHHHLLI